MDSPSSECDDCSDCPDATYNMKDLVAVSAVISWMSISILSKKPKISFLIREIDSVSRLTKTNETIVAVCFGNM